MLRILQEHLRDREALHAFLAVLAMNEEVDDVTGVSITVDDWPRTPWARRRVVR